MQPQTKAKIITVWLSLCLLVIAAIMVTDGTARLRENGLSINDIHPVSHTAIPKNDVELTKIFEYYTALPDFKKYFPEMELNEFSTLYWLKYTKYFLIQLVFPLVIFPFILLSVTSFLEIRTQVKLVCVFCFGLLSFLLHHYWVNNGLIFNQHLDAYRIAAENILQYSFFALLLWQILTISHPHNINIGLELAKPKVGVRLFACVVFIVLLAEIFLGSTLNGVHSELKYNIFPATENQLVPEELFALTPLYKNFFEDVTTIQFTHRITAYILSGLIVLFWLVWRNNPHIAHLLPILFSINVVQFLLGVLTLLFAAPVRLSSLHQSNTLLLYAVAVTLLHRLFIPIKRMSY